MCEMLKESDKWFAFFERMRPREFEWFYRSGALLPPAIYEAAHHLALERGLCSMPDPDIDPPALYSVSTDPDAWKKFAGVSGTKLR